VRFEICISGYFPKELYFCATWAERHVHCSQKLHGRLPCPLSEPKERTEDLNLYIAVFDKNGFLLSSENIIFMTFYSNIHG